MIGDGLDKSGPTFFVHIIGPCGAYLLSNLCYLTVLELCLNQPGIETILAQQLLVRSLLHDTTLIQHQNHIRVADRA